MTDQKMPMGVPMTITAIIIYGQSVAYLHPGGYDQSNYAGSGLDRASLQRKIRPKRVSQEIDCLEAAGGVSTVSGTVKGISCHIER